MSRESERKVDSVGLDLGFALLNPTYRLGCFRQDKVAELIN